MDFTYPSLEEPVPSKLPTQMPPPPIETNEKALLVTDQDEKLRLSTQPALAGPGAAPRAEASPIIQPAPATKSVPQVLSWRLFVCLFVCFLLTLFFCFNVILTHVTQNFIYYL